LFAAKFVNSLAIDYGTKRSGTAIGEVYLLDQQKKINIFPYKTFDSKNRKTLIDELINVIQLYQISQLVVGVLPNKNNQKRQTTILSQKIARQIFGQTHLPYFFVDESYTSVDAKLDAIKQENVDAYAAKIILEIFFANIIP